MKVRWRRRFKTASSAAPDSTISPMSLSAGLLQKPFACRDQFTATHQFDVGVYLRRDTERVRISVSAQHLPVIQPHKDRSPGFRPFGTIATEFAVAHVHRRKN